MFLVVAFHRVGVSHEHHGRGDVALAERAHHAQYLHQADAQSQGAVAGFLDHGTIGRRVGERHAQLDDVGTGLGHAVHQFGGDVGERIAGRDIGNQGLAVLSLEL